MKSHRTPLRFLALLGLVALTACQSGWDPDDENAETEKAAMRRDASAATTAFKSADSTLSRFFNESAGYAVFPNVGKGGLVVGGAHGNGVVYAGGAVDGYSSLSQVTVGLQAGGQEYSEIVFFKDETALDDFRRGNFELSAQASAIAAREGAATAGDYNDGVAIFYLPKGGLMFEASVGGQKFEYWK
ncbi:MAG: YSC84-related protein [Planctomycetota bacterium]